MALQSRPLSVRRLLLAPIWRCGDRLPHVCSCQSVSTYMGSPGWPDYWSLVFKLGGSEDEGSSECSMGRGEFDLQQEVGPRLLDPRSWPARQAVRHTSLS